MGIFDSPSRIQIADTWNLEYHHGMADLTFRQYVKERASRKERVTGDHAAGGFAAGARADRKMPDVKTWGQLELYLVTKGATPATVVAAKKVWKEYRAVRNRRS